MIKYNLSEILFLHYCIISFCLLIYICRIYILIFMAKDETQVQDADIVEPEAAVIPEGNSAEILLNLESMIKSHITGIATRKKELKKYREMLASTLTNSETYRNQNEEVKKATKIRAATKSQIMKEPANAEVSQKAKELSAEIREMDEALSDYLREYGRMSGVNEIESDDGETLEIVYVARLIKKSSRFK